MYYTETRLKGLIKYHAQIFKWATGNKFLQRKKKTNNNVVRVIVTFAKFGMGRDFFRKFYQVCVW
jgi:hypothetical protein